MKTPSVFLLLTFFTVLSFTHLNFAQGPDLGTAANFVLFTTAGAVDNAGVSTIVGDVGTNMGAIAGFGPPTVVIGNIEAVNPVTAQCAIDVLAAYNELFNTVPTVTSHAPAFGSGETLFAGVYAVAAAGSLDGALTLDAQLDPNAVFIFKFGGAFTVGASSTIHLINGAMARNVFWVADGAIAIAALTSMKGTLIANNGAISMGADGILEGRILSTAGAASFYQVSATLPVSLPLPVELLSFSGVCDGPNVVLKWQTATETNNQYFTVERSAEGTNWQTAGTVAGTGNSATQRTYTFTDPLPVRAATYFRLKQTDFNGYYKYGHLIAVKKCGDAGAGQLSIYPNPSDGQFVLSFAGNTNEVYSMTILDSQGRKIREITGFQSTFDLSREAPGIYFLQVQLEAKTLIMKMVVER
jgi:Ice-binding-like/Secretion system C-terminal sorting domain